MDGSVAFESAETQSEPLSEHTERSFDWVDYRCLCPDCGVEVTSFRTRDLCNVFDTVDYRITHHFYAMCDCGTYIDFIRKTAKGIEDFDRHAEQL